MAWFRKKKRIRLPPLYQQHSMMEKKLASREYKLYVKKEIEKKSWYESLANGSTKFLKVEPDKKSKEELENAISFTGLKITPAGPMSLFVSTIVIFAILGIFLLLLQGFKNFIMPMILIIVGVGFGYYFYKYPINQVKVMRIRASSQVVLAILYMVVSMRMSPNLERALRFAAANVTGELATDMRRLLWDIWMRKYNSADEAIGEYIAKWKPENEEFAEALRLIRDSQYHTPEVANKTLDEALALILEGTKTRMKHYTQDLRLPVMVIHMMGIILPVLGTIMAPMASIFLAGSIRAEHFIIGYDIVLPLFILWFIKNTLKKRPTTFSQIDIGHHPGIPPAGSFLIKSGKKKIAFPAFPIAIIITLAILILPILYFTASPDKLIPTGSSLQGKQFPTDALFMSMLIIVSIAVGLAVYFILITFQSTKIQRRIEATESQFELALFQLGNRVGGGVPLEVAISRSIEDVKDLEIAGLFRMASYNMSRLGFSPKDAFFHKKVGAIRYYPSQLIRNIMYTIVDTAGRGVRYASSSMLTISEYLRNIRETQEYIRDILSETVSSMKFQAYMLTPIITGLIVSMSQVITDVLAALGRRLATSGLLSGSGLDEFGVAKIFGDVDKAIPPAIFQLIIGVYLIQVIIILAIFLTKINHGDNKVVQWNMAAKMLLVGIAVYSIVALISATMFADMISGALESFIGGG